MTEEKKRPKSYDWYTISGEAIKGWGFAVIVVVLVAAPLVAVLASWLPALIAAQQDPATVLRDT